MTEAVIEAHGLTKRYGGSIAVDGLDLRVEAGEVFGLLGPNGSGKTTTILMLMGLTEPNAGTAEVLGFDPLRQPLAVKRRVGYLPDSVGFYDHLTARENLAYTARLAGMTRAESRVRIAVALDRVGLAAEAHRRVGAFSRGMRQRLGIAEAVMKDVRIAILDEPTAGLDPQATRELLEIVAGLKRAGMTVLLASHLLGLVESICDRVALFHKGRIGLVGRVEDLAHRVIGGHHVVAVEADGIDLAAVLSGLAGAVTIAPTGRGAVRVDALRDVRPEIARRVVEAGGALRSLAIRDAGLDEVYQRYFEKLADAA